MRNGRKESFHSRWRQDKGHRDEWAAFAQSAQQHAAGPIPFEELVCSTLATLRVDEAVATGNRLAVDTPGFLAASQRTSSIDRSLDSSLDQ